MATDGVLPRFPELLRPGNGIAITQDGGAYRISADLDGLSVTPTDQGAPENLADLLAYLKAQASGTRLITTIDDGFWDVPNSGGTEVADDGWF